MREYLILHMTALLGGILSDILFGDPHDLPHPVRAIGALVSGLEKRLYVTTDRDGSHKKAIFRGALLWIIVILTTILVSAAVIALSYRLGRMSGVAVELVLTYFILAAGSLRDESMRVYDSLGAENGRYGGGQSECGKQGLNISAAKKAFR